MLIGVILFALILAVLVYCAVDAYTSYDKFIDDDEEQLRYIEKWKKNHNVKDKNKHENGKRGNQ